MPDTPPAGYTEVPPPLPKGYREVPAPTQATQVPQAPSSTLESQASPYEGLQAPITSPPQQPWPEWFERGLEIAHKYGVALPNKIAEPVIKGTKEAFQFPMELFTGLKNTPQAIREAQAATFGQPPPVPKETLEEQTGREHPYIQGIAGGAGEVLGGAVGDPRNWPFLASGAARPLLQKLISGGFGVMMSHDAIEEAGYLKDNWGKLNTQEKSEGLTKLGLGATMAGLSTTHAILGGDVRLTTQEHDYISDMVKQHLADGIKSGDPATIDDAISGLKVLIPELSEKRSTQGVSPTGAERRSVESTPQGQAAIRLAMIEETIENDQRAIAATSDPAEKARLTEHMNDFKEMLNEPATKQATSNLQERQGEPPSGPVYASSPEVIPLINAQGVGAEDIRADQPATRGGGSTEVPTGAGTEQVTDGGEASQRELSSLIPEFNKVIGGGEGPRAHPAGEGTGAYPAAEDEPPPPVISRLVDDDLAASGVNIVRRGEDINLISRFLGSFNESARKLEAEGHPLGSALKSMAGLISNVTKTIAANQTDTVKAFINGSRKMVSRDEWSNQVVPLMDRQVTERPANVPDHIWDAYQSARALDEALRVKIINAKRQELQLNGFRPEQAQEWYPDTWGKAGEHYPHLFPGTWTITRLAEVDERTGTPKWEAIGADDISWRASSEMEAKKAAQAYLASHPGEQLKVQQDTISMPGSGISDRSRLRDLNDKVKDATTRIVDGGADPEEVLRQLYDQSGAAAYGPRNAAKRQFGPALQRETNLQGFSKDIEDFQNYLMSGERYVQLAPARQMLMKGRNQLAQLAGMPQVQKINEFPAPIRYSSAAQYGNILARLDSAIEGLEGHPGMWDAAMRYWASGHGWDPDIVNKAARPIQQMVALTKLGFQPARVLSHGLQTAWAVYPVLGEKSTLLGMAHSFDHQYDWLIRDLAVTHSGNMSDIEGLREYTGSYFGRGATPLDMTKGAAHIVRDLGLMPFTAGIDFTRRVAAVGGFLEGIDRGFTPEGAKNFARDVMDRTTGMYNAADNPTFLRQLPGPVAQFKGFMLKTMQFMFNLRGAEIPRFLLALGAMGAVGFPAFKMLSNLVEQSTGYNPENDLKRKFPVASRGAFGALGVDQPSAVGFADWFASRPGIPLAGMLGPAGSDIANFAKAGMERFKGPSREAEQDLDTALRQLSPEGRRIWDEAVRGTSNAPSLIDPRTGSTIIKSLTPLERIEALAGFTPMKVAQERESHEYIRNELAKAKDQRGYFVDKLAENQLELMRPGLTSDQKADLTKETLSLQKLAIEYNQARNLVPAVRDRIRGMLQERLERDLRKAPRSERPLIYQEEQRYKQENP